MLQKNLVFQKPKILTQGIIMDAAIVGGLYANASIFGTSKKVEGFKFDPYAQPEFFDVWIK